MLRRVLQLHRVRFLPREIDQDLIQEDVPVGHATKAPTLVQTKGPGLQFLQLIGRFWRQLSCFNEFLEFGVHADW